MIASPWTEIGRQIELQQWLRDGTETEAVKMISFRNIRISEHEANIISGLNFNGLVGVSIQNCEILPGTITKIFSNPFPSIKSIKLRKINVGDSQFIELINNRLKYEQLLNIKVLSVIQTAITGSALRVLTQNSFDNLTELALNFNRIGSIGAKYLSKSNFPRLQMLYAGWCQLGDQGAKNIVKSTQINGLIWLNIWDNKFSFDGYLYLANHHCWKQLSIFYLTYEAEVDGCDAVSKLALVPQAKKMQVNIEVKQSMFLAEQLQQFYPLN